MKAQTVPDTCGLVPAISIRRAQCPPKRDRRDIRVFTPVFERVKKLAPRLTCDSLSLQREVIR
jgi:hypothetical protein